MSDVELKTGSNVESKTRSKKKKRILHVGEASFVCSGFGTYGWEVLRRLHATGKYEIAELASYGAVGDQRANKMPW